MSRWSIVPQVCKSMKSDPKKWYQSNGTCFYYGPNGERVYFCKWLPLMATVEISRGREYFFGPIACLMLYVATYGISEDDDETLLSWSARTSKYWSQPSCKVWKNKP